MDANSKPQTSLVDNARGFQTSASLELVLRANGFFSESLSMHQ